MSYLKLRNVLLEYTLPTGFNEFAGLRNARVFISAGELFTISSGDFSGADPENPGAFYPLPRTYTLGINLSL
jgi:hypothetical protein